MLTPAFLISLCTIANARLYTTSPKPSRVGRYFLEHKIVPQVFEDLPQDICQVTYANVTIDPPAKKIAIELVQQKPINVTWKTCNPEKYYMLMLTDIDGGRKVYDRWGEWTVWSLYDIIDCDISQAKEKYHYDVYGHPRRKGQDRHVFQIFEQPRKFEGDFPPDWRSYMRYSMIIFNIKRLFPLKGLVAGNFFYMVTRTNYKYEPTKLVTKSTILY